MLKPNFAGGWFWRVWKLKIGHYWLSNSGGLGSFAEKSCLLNKVRTGGVNVKLESLDVGYWVYEVTSGTTHACGVVCKREVSFKVREGSRVQF